MLYHASFYPTEAQRDAAYTAMGPLLRGTDHGVSGPDANNETMGWEFQWQIWSTQPSGDAAAFDAAARGAGASVTRTVEVP